MWFGSDEHWWCCRTGDGLIEVGEKMIDRQMTQEADALLLRALDYLGDWDINGCDPRDPYEPDFDALANSFLALGRPAEAVRACEMLPPIDRPSALEIKARANVMEGHHELAREGFEEALGKFETLISVGVNSKVAALVGAARCRIGLAAMTKCTPEQKEENLQAALRHLQAALELRPDDVSIKLLAADVQLRRGKPGAALEGFKQVLAHKPWLIEALRGKATAQGDLGLPRGALMTALELPAGDPVLRQSVLNAVTGRILRCGEAASTESKK